jgi:hypothetical protein
MNASAESKLELTFEDTVQNSKAAEGAFKSIDTSKPLSLLGDLPALGLSSESSMLGDLPPLGGTSRGELPPLMGGRRKELPALSRNKDLSPLSSINKEPHLLDLSKGSLEKAMSKESENNEQGEKDAKDCEFLNDNSVSEDIAEDLDSFSSQSAADQFTKEEPVVNSDSSLKADHVESL